MKTVLKMQRQMKVKTKVAKPPQIPYQTVSKMFELTGCFTMFDQMFDIIYILSNMNQHNQTRC